MTFALLLTLAAAWGMRHAFEPDHLATIFTLVSRERKPRTAVTLGAAWGLGHSIALLGVTAALALAKTGMPSGVTVAFECGVGMILIFFGCQGVMRSVAQRGRLHRVHRHDGLAHVHPLEDADKQLAAGRLVAIRSALVGGVHGLAGSGVLTALVAAKLPTSAGRLAYVAVFGIGSLVGMAAISGVAGMFVLRVGQHPIWERTLQGATGALALIIGVVGLSVQLAPLWP